MITGHMFFTFYIKMLYLNTHGFNHMMKWMIKVIISKRLEAVKIRCVTNNFDY